MVEIERLRSAAWVLISTATVDGAESSKYWKAWTTHCRLHYHSSGGAQAATDITDRTASEQLSRFIQLKNLSGTSPKELFWTDIRNPEKPLQPSNILTSLSPDC